MKQDKRPDMVDARRRFLATCGRFAVITPPVVTLLLSSTTQNYAVAGSGHGRRRGRHSDTNGVGNDGADGTPRGLAGTEQPQDDKRPV